LVSAMSKASDAASFDSAGSPFKTMAAIRTA
jgi:hypothetical protein